MMAPEDDVKSAGFYVDPDDYDLDTPRHGLDMPVLRWMHHAEHDWSQYTGANYQA